MPYPWYFPIIFKIWMERWAKFTDIEDTTAFTMVDDSTAFDDVKDTIKFTEVTE